MKPGRRRAGEISLHLPATVGHRELLDAIGWIRHVKAGLMQERIAYEPSINDRTGNPHYPADRHAANSFLIYHWVPGRVGTVASEICHMFMPEQLPTGPVLTLNLKDTPGDLKLARALARRFGGMICYDDEAKRIQGCPGRWIYTEPIEMHYKDERTST